RGQPPATDPGIPFAASPRPRGGSAKRAGGATGPAPLCLHLCAGRLHRRLATTLARAPRPLPLSHAGRPARHVPGAGAGADLPALAPRAHAGTRVAAEWRGPRVRLSGDGDRVLPLLLSALDRAAAHRGLVEQPRLVRVRQALAQLVSLLLDVPGLALVAGCL